MHTEINSTAPSANNGATPTANVTEQVSASPPPGPPTNPPSTSQPPRPFTRRERFKDDPLLSNPFLVAKADQAEAEPPPPDDTIRVEYTFKIRGGKEFIVDVKSKFDLPMALREECLARTDTDFPEVIDKIVVSPLIERIRTFLQTRFEAFAQAKTAAPEAPGHGTGKPPNGSRYTMPKIDPMPPLATMPGKVPLPPGKIGN